MERLVDCLLLFVFCFFFRLELRKNEIKSINQKEEQIQRKLLGYCYFFTFLLHHPINQPICVWFFLIVYYVSAWCYILNPHRMYKNGFLSSKILVNEKYWIETEWIMNECVGFWNGHCGKSLVFPWRYFRWIFGFELIMWFIDAVWNLLKYALKNENFLRTNPQLRTNDLKSNQTKHMRKCNSQM